MSKKTQANKMLKGTPKPGSARERLRQQTLEQNRRRNRLRVIVAVVVIAAVLVVSGIVVNYFMSRGGVSVDDNKSTGNEVTQGLGEHQPMTWGKGDRTLRIYFDFNCAHCVEFEHEYGDIIDDALNSGKWKVEFYPMAFLTETSLTTANAFVCASEDGYGYHFQKSVWKNAGKQWDEQQIMSLAEQVSGKQPSAAFTSCVKDKKHNNTLTQNTQFAFNNNVPGTPYVLIDGEPVNLQYTSPEELRKKLGV